MHQRYSVVGMASWYGSELHGHATADGEIFDMRSLSAAHRSMPLPSYARVTNLSNGRSIVVRVNDRGPFVRGRIVDVSARVAEMLEFNRAGVTKVRLDYIGKAPPAGSDGPALLASLQTGGSPLAARPAAPAGSIVSALLTSLQTIGRPAAAPPAPQAVRPAAEEGTTVVPRVANVQETDRVVITKIGFDSSDKAPASGSGGLALFPSLPTGGALAFSGPAGVATRTADQSKIVVARVGESPPATEPRSPYGDLISSPFLAQLRP
jgi:rare lipoprotein A